MTPVLITPERHSEFVTGSEQFRLVIPAEQRDAIGLADGAGGYRDIERVLLHEDETLESAFDDGRCPDGADVLVICPDTFVVSPEPAALGERRLAVMPCGSTPATVADVGRFVPVVEGTDHQDLEDRAVRLLDGLASGDEVSLADSVTGATASFAVFGDYEWNQQAGLIGPGEQQIAPAGEISAVPADLFTFDTTRRLGLSGTVALHGATIVHRSGAASDLGRQAGLYRQLRESVGATVLLDLSDGSVTGVRAHDVRAEPAARALADLYEADERYRIVWEFGIGINPRIVPVDGNCGMNEMHGGANGVVHLGFGLTPDTEFALTFACDTTSVRAADGRTLVGAPPAASGPSRMKRVKSIACGCNEMSRPTA